MAHETAGERRIDFDGATGRGAIVFDATRVEQAIPAWFDADAWGSRARPVDSGGRGAAWFVDAPFGDCVLRGYRRGGLAARVSRSSYVWTGEARVRSVAEFFLLREVRARGVPVPTPIAAFYLRSGLRYRAAILIERIPAAVTLAERVARGDAPWNDAGRLVARAHRAGLDHADLNASNILFDGTGDAWLIDLDRGRLRAPARSWRDGNLARLQRSLLKLRGERTVAEIDAGFGVLHAAYHEEFGE